MSTRRIPPPLTATGPAATSVLGRPSRTLLQGWAMKKKRKRMQGYAMRYLTLTAGGSLQYSHSPASPLRDEIDIPHARVLSSPKDLSIHVDDGEVVFHLRMLTEPDFVLWRETLRDLVLAHGHALVPRPIYAPQRDTYDLAHRDLAPVLQTAQDMQRLVAQIRTAPLGDQVGRHLAQIEQDLHAIYTYIDANVPPRPAAPAALSPPDRTHRPAGSFADVDLLPGDHLPYGASPLHPDVQ